MTFDSKFALQLAEEAMGDEGRMTIGPWRQCAASDSKCVCGLIWAGHGNDTVARSYSAEDESHGRHEDGAAICSMRNRNLACAEQLRAAVEEIEKQKTATREAWKSQHQVLDVAQKRAVQLEQLTEERDALRLALRDAIAIAREFTAYAPGQPVITDRRLDQLASLLPKSEVKP